MPLSPVNFRSVITVYEGEVIAQETGGAVHYRGQKRHDAIPCKIVDVSDKNVRSFGATEVVVSHKIITPIDVSDTVYGDDIVDDDDRIYRVDHVSNEGDVDELWTIFANRQD